MKCHTTKMISDANNIKHGSCSQEKQASTSPGRARWEKARHLHQHHQIDKNTIHHITMRHTSSSHRVTVMTIPISPGQPPNISTIQLRLSPNLTKNQISSQTGSEMPRLHEQKSSPYTAHHKCQPGGVSYPKELRIGLTLQLTRCCCVPSSNIRVSWCNSMPTRWVCPIQKNYG